MDALPALTRAVFALPDEALPAVMKLLALVFKPTPKPAPPPEAGVAAAAAMERGASPPPVRGAASDGWGRGRTGGREATARSKLWTTDNIFSHACST